MEQQHKLPYRVQALLITGRIDPPPRVWHPNTPGRVRKKGYRRPITKSWKLTFASLSGSTKEMIMYEARLKCPWINKNLSSPLLRVGRCYGFDTPHRITTSERPSLLKVGASRDPNARGIQIIPKSRRTWQCPNSWAPPPPNHPRRCCPFLLLLAITTTRRKLKQSRDWLWQL